MKRYLIKRIFGTLKKCCGHRYVFRYNRKEDYVEEYVGSIGFYWRPWSFISNHIFYLL